MCLTSQSFKKSITSTVIATSFSFSLKPALEIHHRLRESLVFRLVIDEIRILVRLQQTLQLIGCLERIL